MVVLHQNAPFGISLFTKLGTINHLFFKNSNLPLSLLYLIYYYIKAAFIQTWSILFQENLNSATPLFLYFLDFNKKHYWGLQSESKRLINSISSIMGPKAEFFQKCTNILKKWRVNKTSTFNYKSFDKMQKRHIFKKKIVYLKKGIFDLLKV